jgi:hypothetical protein
MSALPARSGTGALVEACLRARVQAPPPVSSIAVTTCDRSETLRRCLETHLAGARRCGRRFVLLVLDDSTDPQVRRRNRGIAGALAAAHGVQLRYGGRADREAFVGALVSRGRVPEELARFALLGLDGLGTTGANRNTALLDTVGEMIVAADDDTTWGVAQTEASAGLHLARRPDLGEFEFFADLESAQRWARCRDDVDFVGLHERLLGRSLADTIRRVVPAGGLHGEGWPAERMESVVGGAAHTPVTQMGVVGDSGTASPFPFLTLEGLSRDRLLASEAKYQAARTSRAVMRRVSRLSVSAHRHCMGYVLGLDNRRDLPPFFPVLRNSDGIFGAVLRASMPDAYIGQLPEAVLNDPPEPRRWERDAIWTAPSRWRVCDLVAAAIAAGQGAGPGRAVGGGLVALGQRLVALAERPLDAFEEALCHQRCLQNAVRARQLTACLDRHGCQPAYWAADVRRALDRAVAAASERRLPPADDLPPTLPERDRRLLARRLVRSFGALLAWWPALLAEVRALQAAGIRITEPA